MYRYFEFIIPWTTRWKKFFDNDIELFIIWGVIVLNKTVKIKKVEGQKLNIESWRSEIEKLNSQGIKVDNTNLKIAENVPIILPFYKKIDEANEIQRQNFYIQTMCLNV